MELSWVEVGLDGLDGQGGKAIGFFLRDQLAAPYTGFNNLINTLNTTQLIAPVYLITAGVNPGAHSYPLS